MRLRLKFFQSSFVEHNWFIVIQLSFLFKEINGLVSLFSVRRPIKVCSPNYAALHVVTHATGIMRGPAERL